MFGCSHKCSHKCSHSSRSSRTGVPTSGHAYRSQPFPCVPRCSHRSQPFPPFPTCTQKKATQYASGIPPFQNGGLAFPAHRRGSPTFSCALRPHYVPSHLSNCAIGPKHTMRSTAGTVGTVGNTWERLGTVGVITSGNTQPGCERCSHKRSRLPFPTVPRCSQVFPGVPTTVGNSGNGWEHLGTLGNGRRDH